MAAIYIVERQEEDAPGGVNHNRMAGERACGEMETRSLTIR